MNQSLSPYAFKVGDCLFVTHAYSHNDNYYCLVNNLEIFKDNDILLSEIDPMIFIKFVHHAPNVINFIREMEYKRPNEPIFVVDESNQIICERSILVYIIKIMYPGWFF